MICPRFPSRSALSRNRGRRESRVHAAPAVSRAMCTRKCAHEHTGLAETSRPSLRDGFTAYTCSPRRDHAGLSPSSMRASASHEFATCIGAARPHDFAVRLACVTSIAHKASTASSPTFRTFAQRPSYRVRWRIYRIIRTLCKPNYFCERDWTPQITLRSLGKFDFWRREFPAEIRGGRPDEGSEPPRPPLLG